MKQLKKNNSASQTSKCPVRITNKLKIKVRQRKFDNLLSVLFRQCFLFKALFGTAHNSFMSCCELFFLPNTYF